MTNPDDKTLQFVGASFPSIWALELLLTLKHDRAPATRVQLVETLRASGLVVAKAIDALVAAGLASVEGDTVQYLPVNREIEAAVERVELLYRSRPNAVRRAIVASSMRNATAFADAFKLRRDTDD
ncbi:MAG: hypothetical protein ABI626_03745 [Sphingomicrobium sp.]